MSEGVSRREFPHAEGWPLSHMGKTLYFAHVPSGTSGCQCCALRYGESACMMNQCNNGTFLTEGRYLRAKLLGIENLEPK